MLRITFILVFFLSLLSDATSKSKSCKVPNIKNGEFGRYTSSVNFEKVSELESIKDEEVLTLRCLEGYAPDPRQNNNSINGFFEEEVTCGNGKWSKNFSCRSIRCGNPPVIKNGYPTVGNITHREKNHGAVVKYFCRDNRKLVDKGRVECYFGKWIGEPAECIDNSCYIPDVKNGEMGRFETRYSNNNYSGFKKFSIGQRVNQSETVHLRCEDGYFPAEESSIYYKNQLEIKCEGRTWSKVLLCKAAPCLGKPPNIDNGDPVTNSREHGYVMRYMCNDNVTAKMGNVTCHFGSWIGNTPICPDSKCSVDKLTYQGLLKGYQSSYRDGEAFKIICDSRYRLADGNRDRIRCEEGTWNLPSGFSPCIPETFCEVPKRPEYGYVNFHGSEDRPRAGSIAIFSCERERILHGPTTSKCLEIGEWTFPPPKCLEPCRVKYIPNGEIGKYVRQGYRRIVYEKIKLGTLVEDDEDLHLRCSDGFDASGSERQEAKISCKKGKWSVVPHCEPAAKCSIRNLTMSVPEGVVPDMTLVTGEFMPLGSEIQLECIDLNIKGNSKAVCGSLGKWQLGSFQCVPGCLLKVDPSSHLLIQPLKDSYRFGEFVLLSCPPGEEMSYHVERLICLGKAWSHPIPDCKVSN